MWLCKGPCKIEYINEVIWSYYKKKALKPKYKMIFYERSVSMG